MIFKRKTLLKCGNKHGVVISSQLDGYQENEKFGVRYVVACENKEAYLLVMLLKLT